MTARSGSSKKHEGRSQRLIQLQTARASRLALDCKRHFPPRAYGFDVGGLPESVRHCEHRACFWRDDDRHADSSLESQGTASSMGGRHLPLGTACGLSRLLRRAGVLRIDGMCWSSDKPAEIAIAGLFISNLTVRSGPTTPLP